MLGVIMSHVPVYQVIIFAEVPNTWHQVGMIGMIGMICMIGMIGMTGMMGMTPLGMYQVRRTRDILIWRVVLMPRPIEATVSILSSARYVTTVTAVHIRYFEGYIRVYSVVFVRLSHTARTKRIHDYHTPGT